MQIRCKGGPNLCRMPPTEYQKHWICITRKSLITSCFILLDSFVSSSFQSYHSFPSVISFILYFCFLQTVEIYSNWLLVWYESCLQMMMFQLNDTKLLAFMGWFTIRDLDKSSCVCHLIIKAFFYFPRSDKLLKIYMSPKVKFSCWVNVELCLLYG